MLNDELSAEMVDHLTAGILKKFTGYKRIRCSAMPVE